MSTTRREILYQISLTAAAAQSHPAHKPPSAGKSKGPYRRRFFNEYQFKALQLLSQLIIPADERSQGGIEGGTAEFIDFMATKDQKLQAQFTKGLDWLDGEMKARHGKSFIECSREHQREMLDSIAYRSKSTPDLAPGVAFFALMRSWTVDAFYTSKIGIEDIGYVGNAALAEFNGCPDEVVGALLEKSPV